MHKISFILAILLSLTSHGVEVIAQERTTAVEGSFLWVPGKLIPNEFALLNGTWSNSSIRECMNKCSVNKTCSGFSVQKAYGDAWQSGCKNGQCEEKTECHAKGPSRSSEFWLPTDRQIRVPKVDASSNAWINDWGTILKK